MGISGLQPVNLFMTLFPFILSSLIVGVRVWRRVTERKFAIEDALIVIAQVLLLGLTVTTWIFIKKSYTGYHLENIPEGAVNRIETGKWRYVNAVIYNPTLALIKISFLITLIKLEASSRPIHIALWTLFAINVAFFFAGTLAAMLSCVPIPKFWDPNVPGYCIDKKKYIYSTIAVTIITDVLVTLMPAWILYGLQMPRRNKAVIICFLSLGLIVAAIACYRLSYFVKVFKLDDPLRKESPYNLRTPLSNIEGNLAAIAACGPTLKWILGRFFPFFDSSRTTTPGSKVYTANNSTGRNSKFSRRAARSKLEDELDVTVQDMDNDDALSGDGSVVELENQLGWKGTRYRAEADADGRSDEQRINGLEDADGIMKTVEWHVRGKDGRFTPTKPRPMV